jgi:hypothetical protein
MVEWIKTLVEVVSVLHLHVKCRILEFSIQGGPELDIFDPFCGKGAFGIDEYVSKNIATEVRWAIESLCKLTLLYDTK